MGSNETKETSEKQKKASEKRTYIAQSDVPIYSLDEALRVPRAIIDNYASKPTTPLNLASALDMSPNSGTFRNLCGSAIAYGLTSGGYNAKEIAVEHLAERIISPTEEDDDLAAKREAALKPNVLGGFIRKYENSPLPRHDIALNVLVGMRVPKERAESVYTMILDTAQSVGFIKEIKGKQYIDLSGVRVAEKLDGVVEKPESDDVEGKEALVPLTHEKEHIPPAKTLGQGIFVAHGKNKKPLEQLKRILDQFKIPYKVAVEEPNLGRPISIKVKEIMESCNCAILIFTADEEFFDKDGSSVWRPSENVVYELGASGYLYENRIVILKEDRVQFPSNFRDIGYISFAEDLLEAKSMQVLAELIGFGIVKIST